MTLLDEISELLRRQSVRALLIQAHAFIKKTSPQNTILNITYFNIHIDSLTIIKATTNLGIITPHFNSHAVLVVDTKSSWASTPTQQQPPTQHRSSHRTRGADDYF